MILLMWVFLLSWVTLVVLSEKRPKSVPDSNVTGLSLWLKNPRETLVVLRRRKRLGSPKLRKEGVPVTTTIVVVVVVVVGVFEDGFKG